MRVKEVMHLGAQWCSPEASLAEIACKMRDSDVGSVPVAENDRLVGMITDRDIAVRAVAEGRDPRSTTARDIMTDSINWCYDDADVAEAANTMKSRLVRRLPVVDHDKRLVGMVSVGDITRASPDMAGETLRTLSSIGS